MGNKNELIQNFIFIKAAKNVNRSLCSQALKKAALGSFFAPNFSDIFFFGGGDEGEQDLGWFHVDVRILVNMTGIGIAAVAHCRCWKYPLLQAVPTESGKKK